MRVPLKRAEPVAAGKERARTPIALALQTKDHLEHREVLQIGVAVAIKVRFAVIGYQHQHPETYANPSPGADVGGILTLRRTKDGVRLVGESSERNLDIDFTGVRVQWRRYDKETGRIESWFWQPLLQGTGELPLHNCEIGEINIAVTIQIAVGTSLSADAAWRASTRTGIQTICDSIALIYKHRWTVEIFFWFSSTFWAVGI